MTLRRIVERLYGFILLVNLGISAIIGVRLWVEGTFPHGGLMGLFSLGLGLGALLGLCRIWLSRSEQEQLSAAGAPKHQELDSD